MPEATTFTPTGFSKIASDIPGSEGPLVTTTGRIFIVGPSAGDIWEIKAHGEKVLFANTGGVPAGLQLHRDGSIWIADMKLGILRIPLPEATVEPVVTEFEGQPMRGCNDCAFDSQGNLYFTAPAGSSADNPCGEFYCRLIDGSIHRLDQGFAFSNGIAVSADDRTVIVAETFTKKLHGYRLTAPGEIGEKFLFGTLPGDHRGGPDGMDFDSTGNLIVTNWGGGHLEIFSPEGVLTQRAKLPFANPSNIHFTSPEARELLITEHSENGLWRCDWPTNGQRQYGWGN